MTRPGPGGPPRGGGPKPPTRPGGAPISHRPPVEEQKVEKPTETEVLEQRKPTNEPEESKLIMEFPDDSMVDASMDKKDTTIGTISTGEKDHKDSGGSGAVSESNSVDQSKANGQGMPQI